MKHILLAFALALLAAAAAPAEDISAQPLYSARPRRPSTPALQYGAAAGAARTPSPGNAVDHYRQADQEHEAGRCRLGGSGTKRMNPGWPRRLRICPHDEVGKFLKQCESTFKEMDAGARSEDCDWGLAEELRKKGLAWRPARTSRRCGEIAFLLAAAGPL